MRHDENKKQKKYAGKKNESNKICVQSFACSRALKQSQAGDIVYINNRPLRRLKGK